MARGAGSNFGVGQFQPSEFLKPFFVVAHGLAAVASAKSDKKLPVFTLSGGAHRRRRGLADAAARLRIDHHLRCGVDRDAGDCRAQPAHPRRAWRRRAWSGSCSPISSTTSRQVRIDGFLFGEGDNFQTENAMRTLTAGGLFGMGPGGGTRKFGLPEPHTDYIFSVIGEEFGLIACIAIACLYLGIVARVLIKLLDEESQLRDPRRRRAGHPVRAAGADQHGGQRPDRAVEGHDPAVHQLWRIVDAGAVDRRWDCCSPSRGETPI